METNAYTNKTALLVCDLINSILQANGEPAELLAQSKKAIDFARSENIPVIYIVVQFRKGYPDINPNNKFFEFVRNGKIDLTENTESTRIHSAVQPQENDFIITKRRISAFSGSDLEAVLKSLAIETLVLCGISTSGVILSTTREASDKDYKITILKDACFNKDEEVHQVLINKVLTTQASVVTVDEWINSFKVNY